MYQLSGVGFIVAFGLPFEFFLNAAFYLGQAFHSVLCLFETVVGTGLGFEQSRPCGFKCAVNGDAADLVAACQGGDAFLPLRVGQPNGLAVVAGVRRVFLCMFMFQYSPGNTVNNATSFYSIELITFSHTGKVFCAKDEFEFLKVDLVFAKTSGKICLSFNILFCLKLFSKSCIIFRFGCHNCVFHQ